VVPEEDVQVGLTLGVRGRERKQRETLRSETSKPRQSSSPWIRGAPQEFSTAIFRIRARTSRGRGGWTERLPRLDSQFQQMRKQARCRGVHPLRVARLQSEPVGERQLDADGAGQAEVRKAHVGRGPDSAAVGFNFGRWYRWW
jgi:hypothetical protein